MNYLFTKIPEGCKTFLLTVLLLFNFVNTFSTTLSLGSSATQTKTPINFYYTDTYQGCQMIYTADELDDFRNCAEISAISFYYENASTGTVPSINFSIKMGTTTASYFASNTDMFSTSSLTQVANITIGGWATKSSGWLTINLNTPFKYTGGNLLIDIRNTAKGSYSNNVYFASSTVSNYKTLSWTGASSATATSISSGSRTTARPNIQFTYTLYSDLTGESEITYIYCPEPGKFFQLYEEAGFPHKVKVGGYLGSQDFADLSQCYYSDYDAADYYFEYIKYLDLSEVILENNRLSFDFGCEYWIRTLVLSNNCEFFETYYYLSRSWYYTSARIIENVYTLNRNPFGMTYNNPTGMLHVPSGTKKDWEEQLAKGTNNENNDNSLNNCMVLDTPIKTVSNYYQLSSSDIANVDVLIINGDVDARTFKALNSMPQLNKLVINGNINSYSGEDGPIDAYTYYPANEIPTNAFKDNKTLHYIELGNCNNIGDSAFKNATNLFYFKKTITSDNLISVIGNYAFDGCVKLNRIVNSGGNDSSLGFTSIGDFAFRNTKLTSIELSSRMAYTNIWDDGSEDVFNPYYVPFTHIGKNPFFGVYSSYGIKSRYLFSVPDYEDGNYGPFSLDEDCGYDNQTPKLLIKDNALYAFAVPEYFGGVYKMDDKIHHIMDYGISDVYLRDITISSTLETVGEAFLYKCPDLKYIKGSSPAFVAKDSVLYNYDMSTLVKFPSNHPFTEFHLPFSVEYIEKWAFEGVKNLTALYVYKKEPIDIEREVFENVDKDALTLYVPYGSKSAYMAAEGWSEFTNIVELEPVSEVTVTINEYGCATYCSMYDLDFGNVDCLKAYAATGYKGDGQVVTLTRVQTAEAGVGLFLKGEPGEYVVPVIESTYERSLNMLVGTLEPTTVNSTDGTMNNYKFTIADGDATPMFYPFEDGTTLSAGKAYLQIPTAWLPTIAKKSLSIRFDDGETTDVDEVKGENEEVKTVYDLQGRVVEEPTNGIYIIDGKKVIIK